MADITLTRFIDAAPDRVFAAATDLAQAPKHIRAIEKLDVLTAGPVRLGTRFRETRKMFGREATEEMEIVAFDPPRGYAVGCESHGCRYHTEFRFTPKGAGTEVEMVFEATPLTFMAKTMAAMMKPMMKKVLDECAKDLDDLKTAIEAAQVG